MDMEDFELVVQDLDELFGPDMALFSPLSATTETQYSAAMFGALEEPLPIHLVGAINDEASRNEGTASPSSSTLSIHSSASETDTFGDNDRAIGPFTSQQRYRVTMKERIRLLHTEASQLVLVLQATQKRIKALAQAQKADAVTHSQRSSEPMWESIAARQQKYREESESKNAHLRKLVESQTRYLRSVQRALRRQPNREEVGIAISSLAPTNRQRLPREVDTVSTFGSLLGRLDEQYSRVNQIWATLGFPDLPCPGRQCLTDKQTVRDEARIEFISRSTLPFRIEAVEEMVWKYLLDVRLRQSTVKSAKLVDYRDRTIQVSFSMESNYNGLVASNTSSSVSRKFVECDRVVFVTLSVTEPFVKNHAAIDGLKFFTTTVRVLKPGSSMPDGSHATVMESFWSTRGYDVDGVSKCPSWKLEPFHEQGIGAMEAAITGEQDIVEDLLVRSEIGDRPTRL